jgi:hypothetical protein
VKLEDENHKFSFFPIIIKGHNSGTIIGIINKLELNPNVYSKFNVCYYGFCVMPLFHLAVHGGHPSHIVPLLI